MSNVDDQPVSLDLHNDHAVFKDGMVNKTISLNEAMGILNDIIRTPDEANNAVVEFQLPFGTYRFGYSKTAMRLAMYIPGQIKTIKYQSNGKTRSFTLPLPNIVIDVNLGLRNGAWAVTDVRFCATHRTLSQLNGDIPRANNQDGNWTIPFPNFYEDGRMCFGQNNMPSNFQADLRGLNQLYNLIHSAPFNNDLRPHNMAREYRSEEGSMNKWFEFLATQTEFPYWALINSPVRQP